MAQQAISPWLAAISLAMPAWAGAAPMVDPIPKPLVDPASWLSTYDLPVRYIPAACAFPASACLSARRRKKTATQWASQWRTGNAHNLCGQSHRPPTRPVVPAVSVLQCMRASLALGLSVSSSQQCPLSYALACSTQPPARPTRPLHLLSLLPCSLSYSRASPLLLPMLLPILLPILYTACTGPAMLLPVLPPTLSLSLSRDPLCSFLPMLPLSFSSPSPTLPAQALLCSFQCSRSSSFLCSLSFLSRSSLHPSLHPLCSFLCSLSILSPSLSPSYAPSRSSLPPLPSLPLSLPPLSLSLSLCVLPVPRRLLESS